MNHFREMNLKRTKALLPGRIKPVKEIPSNFH